MEDIFKNPQTLAHAIKDVASIDLTPRPYNRFEPDKTVWWLVPSTDWPAYKCGKLFFDAGEKTRIERRTKFKNNRYIQKILLPMHQKYIEPTKKYAHLVLNTDKHSARQCCKQIIQHLPCS